MKTLKSNDHNYNGLNIGKYLFYAWMTTVMSFCIYLGYDIYYDYDRTITNAEQNLTQYRIALAEHAQVTFNSTEWVLDQACAYLSEIDVAQVPEKELRENLKKFTEHFPHIGWINIKDANSITLANTAEFPVKRDPHPDLDYMIFHNGNPTSDEIFFSEPAIGKITGKWRFFITRRFIDKKSKFAGVVGCAFDPNYYEAFYRQVQLGETGRFLIVRESDGQPLVMFPFTKEGILTKLGDRPFFKDHVRLKVSDFYRHRVTGYDFSDRWISYQRLDQLPIIVAVSMTHEEIVAPWIKASLMKVMLLLFPLLFAAAFMGALIRKLRSALHRFEILFNITPFSCVIQDFESRYLIVNDSFCAGINKSREEIIGKTQYEVMGFLPDNHKLLQEKLAANGEINQEEVYVKMHDGDHYILVSSKIINLESKPAVLSATFDITHQKLIESQLQKSQEKLSITMQSIGDGVIATNNYGEVSRMNPVAEKLTGWKLEEAEGKQLTEVFNIVNTKTNIIVENPVRKVLATGQVVGLANHTTLIAKSGERYQIADSGAPIRNHKGEIEGVVLVFRDVTEEYDLLEERRRAQAALVESQKELDSIVNTTQDVIYRIDLEGNISFVNNAIINYGYTKDELIGVDVRSLVHPDNGNAVSSRIASWISGIPVEKDFVVRILKREQRDINSGKAIPADVCPIMQVESSGLYSFNDSGEKVLIGIQGIARDITKSRQTDVQMRRLAAAIEQAAEDVIITDLEGKVLYVNPAFEVNTGYSSEEIIGKNPKILKSGLHDEVFYRQLWGTILEGHQWSGRFYNKNKYGDIVIQDGTISPIYNEVGEKIGFVSLKRDVTSQVRLEESIAQTQKLEAIGSLAGGIAHDFNNILSAIIGYSELAAIDMKSNVSAQDNIKQVLVASERARGLVSQILAFSRQSKDKAQPILVGLVAKEVLKLIRATLPTSIEIRQQIDFKCKILIDPTRLHQIFMNLITNASHAMEETGVLTVAVENVLLDIQFCAKHSGLIPGEHIRITISDTGHGIPKEIKDKIFDPFFTTKDLGEGTGLGLSVVHGIVKEAGGAIEVIGTPRLGSSFMLYFPKTLEVTSQTELNDESQYYGNERILFIDDEKWQCDIAKAFLRRFGYSVETYTDPCEALDEFKANPLKYDIIISDMTMPKMTGDILAKRAILQREDIPVVICTGFSNKIDEAKAVAMGIKAFCYKPVIGKELAKVIRKVIDKIG